MSVASQLFQYLTSDSTNAGHSFGVLKYHGTLQKIITDPFAKDALKQDEEFAEVVAKELEEFITKTEQKLEQENPFRKEEAMLQKMQETTQPNFPENSTYR